MQPTLKFSPTLTHSIILLALFASSIFAQQKPEEAVVPFNPGAYQSGERLSYNVDFSHFVSVAHVELFVAGRGTFLNRDGIELRAHVETTGVINVALFAINNDYISVVDPQTGVPFFAQRIELQGGDVPAISNDVSQLAAIPAKRFDDTSGTHNILSALFRLRAMPLAEGSSYFLSLHNDNEEYQAEIKISGKQIIRTNLGSFNAIVARVNLKNKHDFDLRVYFSDDNRHLPVLITARHPAGTIRAELVASEIVPPVVKPNKETSITPATVLPAEKPVPNNTSSGNNQSQKTGTSLARLQAPLDLPFKVGEQLSYQVFLGNTPQSVGSVSFLVKSRAPVSNHDSLQLVATARTTGAGARIFPVNDTISSFVDPETLLPFRTELSLAEGKWQLNRTYEVDQNRGVAMINNRQRVEIPVGTHDLLSLLYAIRTFDLSPQKVNAISILAITEPRTLMVKSERRATIEIGGQKVSTLELSLSTDDTEKNRLQVRMWVGDDSRRLPLRITAVTSFGPVRADLLIVPVNTQ